MSESGSTVRGIAKTLAGQWSKFVIQIAGIAVLARLLTPSEFGTIAMVMALIGVATLLGDFGLSLASLRKPDMGSQERSNLFWLNLLVGVLAALTVLILSERIALFYEQDELASLVAWLSVTFILQAAVGQFRSEVAGNRHYGRLVSVDVGAQLVATLAAVYFAFHGFGYWALVIQQLLFCGLQLVGLAAVSQWFPLLPRGIAQAKDDLIFGAKTSGNQLLNYVSSNVDSVVLGKVWGPAVLGIYNQGYILYKMPVQQIASPLTQVVVPALSRLDGNSFRIHVLKLETLLTYVVGGAFVVLASVSSDFILVFLGEKWNAVAPIFVILALGGIFQVLGFVYYWVFIVKNLVGRHLVVGGATRVIMVVLIIFFVRWGGMGVAWAVTSGLILNWLMLTWLVAPLSGIRRRDFLGAATRPVVFLGIGFSIVVAFQAFVQHNDPFYNLVSGLSVWAIVFLVSYSIWKGFRRDVRGLWEEIPRLLQKRKN